MYIGILTRKAKDSIRAGVREKAEECWNKMNREY